MFQYIADKEYIAEFPCINQDRPELKYDCKCYLMEMLQEQEKGKHQDFPKIDLEDYPIGFVNFMDYVVSKFPFRIHTVQTDNGHEFQSRFN